MFYSSPFPSIKLIHRSAFIHDIAPNRSPEIPSFYTSAQKCILSAAQYIEMGDEMPQAVRRNKEFL